MSSFKFKNVYIKDYYSVAGPLESDSKLKSVDLKLDDYYFGEKTFEKAEIKMQKTVIDNLLFNNELIDSDIDFLIGGDLINQLSITSYTLRDFKIPYLGVYAACSTFTESLLIASVFLNNEKLKNIFTITSSHNLTAERQFRYPVEYGAPKPHTATFTTTGAVGTLLTKEKSNILIESATIGTAIDMGITDVNHMGAVMAPAAAYVLNEHLKDLNREAKYYDLVLTGDLGCVGAKIFEEYLYNTYDIKLKKYLDAGCELYLDSSETYAGGSGPACIPLVLFNKILHSKKYKKILLLATGSLHSPGLVNQHNTIPAISHAVSLEVI